MSDLRTDDPGPWADELAELHRRREMARALGGEEGVAKQRAQGKLLVTDRIDGLVDPGSFERFRHLVGTATYDDHGRFMSVVPEGQIDGIASIDGRRVVLTAGDFTVRGGAMGASHGALGEEMPSNSRALEWDLPLVRLLDASGGSVRTFEQLGRTYTPDGNTWSAVDVALLDRVPVVSAVMGAVAGLPAINACLAHWNVMVRGTSFLFPGGPPVVKAALGIDVTKEDLGGAEFHVSVSGTVDNLADDEHDALSQIRRFLSYLPSSVNELAPLAAPVKPDVEVGELRHLVPRDPRQAFDMRHAIGAVVDGGSFFEIGEHHGRSRITGLARIDGYPVGILANDPCELGGSTDVAAGSKAARLIQLCDTFHLPVVDLADEPGFMVGPDAERQGIETAGARLVAAVCRSRMPMVTFVVGRLFGVAGQCHHRPSGMFRRYAWPSARWGSMHLAGGVSAAYRREIAEAPDPEAELAAIQSRLEAISSVYRTAEVTGQDIIDPVETRARAVDFVRDAQRILKGQVGVPTTPFMR
ncbi:acyl-CoA carboxylase subunit beta [Nonomuraea sp. NPDC050783]|uniref:acyl-CoA carboxylase subunit beta n=1 Tax=Nonomuraea sp. NPDC050783 TaxID=3154634 RepID=UPI00346686A8